MNGLPNPYNYRDVNHFPRRKIQKSPRKLIRGDPSRAMEVAQRKGLANQLNRSDG
jgi:hypothetical protein